MSSVFSSIVSRTEFIGVNSALEIIVSAKLQIINNVATIAVAFVINPPADLDDIKELVAKGVYIEHSMCMFVQRSKYKFYEPKELDDMIKAAGIDKTILGSDLGQVGNPSPVNGFRAVINMCLDLGYDEQEIHKLVSKKASDLMGI